MASQSRFGITAWPGTPIDEPGHLWLPAPVHLDGDLLRLGPVKRGAGGIWIEVPAELYLREVRLLDLTSTKQIEAFVRRFGWMGVGAHIPRWVDERRGDDNTSQFLPLSYELRRSVRRAVSVERPESRPFETLDEFRAAVEWIRDLTRIHSDRQAADLERGPSWWESGRRFDRATFGFGRPRDERQSLHVLATGLTYALRGFHTRVDVVDLATGVEESPAAPLPLFVVLAVQLYNHVADGSVYLTCANETCGGLFVRQQGRAVHGQHRTAGVQFCSKTCARAQAQREYRRRNRRDSTTTKGTKR